METLVLDSKLVSDVKNYLYDAGFQKDLYTIIDFDNMRNYVEVYFLCNQAVDYIKNDVRTSEYSKILEIKKYRHNNGICSAIITYID
jgi:hypothetical protein